jgi:hypothetical protein
VFRVRGCLSCVALVLVEWVLGGFRSRIVADLGYLDEAV